MMKPQSIHPIRTKDGVFNAVFSAQGLSSLTFPNPKKTTSDAAKARPETNAQLKEWRVITEAALKQALAGQAPKTLPPLDLSAGTKFQQSVWKALIAIPSGQTKTYSQVAKAIKRPQAVRAVGQACGANPIPVLVPCHRVVSTQGKLGGFSGGLEWKRLLLERESPVPRYTPTDLASPGR